MIGQQVPQPDVTFNQSLPPFADFQDCVNFSELQSQPQLPEIPSLSPLAFIPKVKEEEIITLSSDEEGKRRFSLKQIDMSNFGIKLRK